MPHSFTGLDPEQAAVYATEGVVRLPAAVPAADVEALRGALWRLVERRCGARRGAPATWTTPRPSQLGARADAFAALAGRQIRALLDQQLGRWREPARWAIPLVAFPMPHATRDVPHRDWHLDAPAGGPPLARLFLVLEPSWPGGGATGYVAGAHRLLDKIAREAGRPLPSSAARKALIARHPWFADLQTLRPGEDRVARFMDEPAVVDGVPLQVREMLGEPGDVLLMHPHMLHTTMPNVRDTPRMMLTSWVEGA